MPHRNRCRAREASTIWNARPGGVAIAAKSSIPLQLVPVGSDPRRLRLWNGYDSGRLALPVFVFYGFPGARTARRLCTHARKLCLKTSSLKHPSTETFLSSFLQTSICSPKIRIIVELLACKVVGLMLPYPLQTLIQRTFLLMGMQDVWMQLLLIRPLPLRFLNTASWTTRAFPRISLSGLCFRFLALLRCTTSAVGPVVSVWSFILILIWKPRSRSTPSMNNRPIGIPLGLRVILLPFLDISIISQKPSFANVPVLTRRRMWVVAPILSFIKRPNCGVNRPLKFQGSQTTVEERCLRKLARQIDELQRQVPTGLGPWPHRLRHLWQCASTRANKLESQILTSVH